MHRFLVNNLLSRQELLKPAVLRLCSPADQFTLQVFMLLFLWWSAKDVSTYRCL